MARRIRLSARPVMRRLDGLAGDEGGGPVGALADHVARHGEAAKQEDEQQEGWKEPTPQSSIISPGPHESGG
jgi:hypothetical protein